ncbi:hypothetical protein D3C77_568130 [compost metagenome]
MLGHHGCKARFEHQHEGREGGLQLDDDGLGVGRGDRINELVQDDAGARMRLGQHLGQREHDVFGRERLAVMPLDVVLQVEGVGQAIGRRLPGFGQARLGLQVGVIGQQAFVDLARDELRGPLLVDGRDDHRRLGLNNHVQGAALGLGQGLGGG